MRRDIIVIGAGAAGLMCAIEAGKRGRSVLVLDHAERPGQKISISGGGRCNFTNVQMGHEHYLSGNPHFCKSALARFTPHDFAGMLEKYNIQYYEKERGNCFAERILWRCCVCFRRKQKAGVELRLKCRIAETRKRPL
jgi:predicted flavoprotein YhiN